MLEQGCDYVKPEHISRADCSVIKINNKGQDEV